MSRSLWYVAIVSALLSIACFLPEVTVDEQLATPIDGMDTGMPPAPPTGGGGDDAERERLCSIYCARFTRVCAGHPAATYDDQRDCDGACLLGDWPLGDLSNDTPNSIRCREYHSFLAETAPAMHCYHAAEFPSMGFCEALAGSSQ